MERTIALLTDFGTTDIYVGVMKAVMRRITPTVEFIDLTHDIQPQNVRQGAFTLLRNYQYFAPGTIFLVVIDPGVGGARKAIGAETGEYTFVGPDNGVLSYVLAEYPDAEIIELSNSDYQLSNVSMTFHGRDIFAPAAAHLANGVPLSAFGGPIRNYAKQLFPQLRITDNTLNGQVMYADHFGNIITSIGELHWVDQTQLMLNPRLMGTAATFPTFSNQKVVIECGNQLIRGIRRTYGEAKKGELLALVNSGGYLEIALNQGNAAAQLSLASGAPITLSLGQ